jgi:hypothetical protein
MRMIAGGRDVDSVEAMKLLRRISLIALLLANGCSLWFDGHDLRGSKASLPGDMATSRENGDLSGSPEALNTDMGPWSGHDMLMSAGDMAHRLKLSFSPASLSPFSIGDSPYGLTLGDFDGDGKLDAATANQNGDSISILFGDGNGGFTIQSYAAPTTTCPPYAIATGRFNGDTIDDIVFTCTDVLSYDGGLVLLGSASRSFTAKTIGALTVTNGTSKKPEAVIAGDFNHDGKADIAVAEATLNQVLVLLGNGDGTFSGSGSSYNVGAGPRAVARADLNGDGRDDLIVANTDGSTINVFIQSNSNALPLTGASYNVGAGPYDIAIGDTDNDTHLDLVTANATDNTLSVLLGAGDGTFPTAIAPKIPPTAMTGDYTISASLADFDRDGNLDLVSAAGSSNFIYVMLGDGKGRFAGATPLNCGPQPDGALPGHFVNSDARADIICYNNTISNSTVTLLLNTSH